MKDRQLTDHEIWQIKGYPLFYAGACTMSPILRMSGEVFYDHSSGVEIVSSVDFHEHSITKVTSINEEEIAEKTTLISLAEIGSLARSYSRIAFMPRWRIA